MTSTTRRSHVVGLALLGALTILCVTLSPVASAFARVSRHERSPHAPSARTAILGGSQIAITQAPWQVAIFVQVSASEELRCGGSIVNPTEIVTAGHCVFDPSDGTQVGAAAVTVVAGTASILESEIEHGATVQVMHVSSVRVHPYFEYAKGAGAPDDVALLTLSSSLGLDPQVQPIPLMGVGSPPAEGTLATLTGFGQQSSSSEPDGALYTLDTAFVYRGECSPEDDALFLCARTATGSACHGDSGGGLTAGSPAVLAGVVDIVEVLAGACVAGARGGFVDLTAPEIRDFIDGATNPPMAPRGGLGIKVRAVPKVGYPVTCEAGPWSGAPTFAYLFIDNRSGQVLQQGASDTYQLGASDVGRTISCEVRATNAGGTGYQRTVALPAVETAGQSPPVQPSHAAPTPRSGRSASSLVLLGATIPVRHGRQVRFTLECLGSANCSGRLTLTAKQRGKRGRTVKIGGASVIIAGSSTAIVTITLNRVGRSLLAKHHGRLNATFAIAASGRLAQNHVVRLSATR